MPKIAFVTGESERKISRKGDREYKTLTNEKTFRYALINQGFDVDTLSLGARDIPADIKALVIADPQNELSATAISKIKAYVAEGGNLLIAGEPGRQQMLNPLLKTLGVQLMNGMLEQESEDYAPTLVLPYATKNVTSFSEIFNKPSLDTLPVSMNGVAGLTYHDTSGFHAEPLLMTKAGAVTNTMRRNPDLDIVNKKDDDNVTQAGMTNGLNGQGLKAKKPIKRPALATNNSKEIFTTALALTRQINGKQQRIFISGDADLLSNLELNRHEPFVTNFRFNTALFSWLDYGQFPVDASRPDSKDNRVTVSLEQLAFLKIIYVWVIPGLILIFGAIFLIRRKRK
jgi:ABC-2 type transport system permease protein